VEAESALAGLLLSVTLRFMRLIKVAFAAGGGAESVSPAQYRMLARLHQGEATVSELAGCHAVTLPTATKILDGLVQRGWIERWRSEADRRQVFVRLTPTGSAALGGATERAMLAVESVLSQLDPGASAQVRGALELLVALPLDPDASASPASPEQVRE